MNWDDWSDKTLSKQVCETIGLTVGDKLSMLRNNQSATAHNGNGYWLEFSINNPADMWPIMLNNAIATVSENGELIGATTSSQQYYEPYGDIVYSYNHHNPLRAAAIVFLMMKGVNPDERI